jgi:hypothetical protein
MTLRMMMNTYDFSNSEFEKIEINTPTIQLLIHIPGMALSYWCSIANSLVIGSNLASTLAFPRCWSISYWFARYKQNWIDTKREESVKNAIFC